VPTIIYDGRSPQPKHNNDQLVLNIDLAPTILDYAGIPVPASMQGSSLRPLTEGNVPKWRNEFYYEHQYDTEGSKVYLPMSEGLVRLKFKYMRYFNGKNPDNFFYEELFQRRSACSFALQKPIANLIVV
jgi:arylsulfatase A-like enzyme